MAVKLLVVSAHIGDFVWRASGTIAKYVKAGKPVHIISLSFGEKGESAGAWRRGAKNIDEVKKIRQHEAECAVKALGGVPLEVLDWGDHPLIINEERLLKLAELIRKYKPEIVLTHAPDDPLRPDHTTTANAVLTAIRLATSDGVLLEFSPIPEPKIFGFDPHIAEQASFYPHVYINITDVYDAKVKAMNCLESQKGEIEYYATRDILRGLQTRRFGRKDYFKYAEAFYMYYPIIGEDFP
jgi:4-oxalomesaconate hydratase